MSAENTNRREFIKNIAGGAAVLGVYPFLAPVYAFNPATTGTGYIYDDRMLDHIISPGHAECPERLIKIQEKMAGTGLNQEVVNLPLLDDPYPYIENIHTSSHISSVKNIPKTSIAAEVSAAGTLGAAKAVCEGTVNNAFCAIRPWGHHAHNSGGDEGFCYYNNVAVATKYVQDVFGIEKVLIIDWDFHHGNATQDTFYQDGTVLVFNTHNWNAYPNTGDPSKIGAGDGYGLNINVHLPEGSGDDDMKRAWEEKLIPKVETFKPDFVFISAGFDSRIDDTLGNLKITDDCFAYITNLALEIARTYSSGRLVSLLEGGYNIDGTASATVTHVAELVKGVTGTDFYEKNKERRHAYIKHGILYLPFGVNELQSLTITNAAGALIKIVSPGNFDNGKIDCNRLGLAAGYYIATVRRRNGKKQGIRFFIF